MQTRFTSEQLTHPEIAASEPIIRKCVHCGFCTATCPTYVLLGDELDGPRGRIYLIKDMLENSRPATGEVVRHIDRCLSCLACMTTCPSGVHYQHLVDHARAYIERTYRRPLRERALRALLAKVLPYPRRLRAALGAAAVLRWAARRVTPLARHLEGRAPAAWRAMSRLAAYRASPPQVPARRPGAAPSNANVRLPTRGRVALLGGCAQSVLTPRTQAACTRLIERAGFEVVVIEGCCGALVHHLGREAETRDFAAALLERIGAERSRGGLAAVVVAASGCGTHLKDFGYLLRDDPVLAEPARELSALTRDITEWLDEHAPFEPSSPRGVAVAYHSACSMQHGQRLDSIPRRLLERAGFEVREIPEGHLCCGSAGTYNILQPQIAAELRERKLANIRSTGAQLVATGNVGCIVQLAGGGIAVVHTAELLDWGAGGPPPV